MTTTPSNAAPPPHPPLSEQAYQQIRRQIIQLELAPGDVLREHELQEQLEIGRTPIREALQRLAREHFIQVIPRRGMFVTTIDVAELSTLLETRFVLEPYAARLAAARGTEQQWDEMARVLDAAVPSRSGRSGAQEPLPASDLLAADRRCHEIMWEAAANRFLLDTLDMLYAQSDRLWHLYLSDVTDMSHAVVEHRDILDALRSGEGDRVAELVEHHIDSFDQRIRAAVTAHLSSPLAG